MMSQHDSFLSLIEEAKQMLLNRIPEEAELIYCIAKLEPDLRAAIIIAYEFLYKDVEDVK